MRIQPREQSRWSLSVGKEQMADAWRGPARDQGSLLELQPARAVHARGAVVRRDWSGSTRWSPRRRKVRRGAALFRNGEHFTSLFAIRTGFFKTRVTAGDGRDQVTGFQMAGEISGWTASSATATPATRLRWRTAEVCVIPFDRSRELSREIGALQHHVPRIMSREIVREHGVMLLLGSMRAEERLAAFLLNLVQRLHARGFSRSELVLRMTREEIGSYLGLKLETVSRCFSSSRTTACWRSVSGRSASSTSRCRSS